MTENHQEKDHHLFERLDQAVTQIESCVKNQQIDHIEELHTQIHLLNEDRSKMAFEMKDLQEYADKLSNSNKTVSFRLAKAIKALRQVLNTDEESDIIR